MAFIGFLCGALVLIVIALAFGFALLPFVLISLLCAVFCTWLWPRIFTRGGTGPAKDIGGYGFFWGLLVIGPLLYYPFYMHGWAQWMGAERSIAKQRPISQAKEAAIQRNRNWVMSQRDVSRSNSCSYQPLATRYRTTWGDMASGTRYEPHCECLVQSHCLADEICQRIPRNPTRASMCVMRSWANNPTLGARPWDKPKQKVSKAQAKELLRAAIARQEATRNASATAKPSPKKPPKATRDVTPKVCKYQARESYYSYSNGTELFKTRCRCRSDADCETGATCGLPDELNPEPVCLLPRFFKRQ